MRGRDVSPIRRFAPPQRLPWRRRAQGLDHIEFGAGAQLAAQRAIAGRPRVPDFCNAPALPDERLRDRPEDGAQRRQHIGRKCGLNRGKNDFIERAIDIRD